MIVVIKYIRFFALLPFIAYGQPKDSIPEVDHRRLTGLVIGSSAVYGVALIGLNELWYKDAGRQSFRFFNDNAEWKQMDKIGHFFSAFYLSYGTSRAMRWCNVRPAKSDLIGSLVGFGLLFPIEIMDGFSDAYGASSGDLLANAAGAAFFFAQSKVWDDIRIYPKFSFHRTDYASIRPTVLGRGLPSEVFKDYNGQTYWLSFDIDKFVRFPRWLNLAVGYSGEGMIYARNRQNVEAGYPLPFRQYYLAIDFDLRAIRSRSKIVNSLIFLASMIKIPSPAIEFSSKGTKFHGFYF